MATFQKVQNGQTNNTTYLRLGITIKKKSWEEIMYLFFSKTTLWPIVISENISEKKADTRSHIIYFQNRICGGKVLDNYYHKKNQGRNNKVMIPPTNIGSENNKTMIPKINIGSENNKAMIGPCNVRSEFITPLILCHHSMANFFIENFSFNK